MFVHLTVRKIIHLLKLVDIRYRRYIDDNNCCASCTAVFVPKERLDIPRYIHTMLLFVSYSDPFCDCWIKATGSRMQVLEDRGDIRVAARKQTQSC